MRWVARRRREVPSLSYTRALYLLDVEPPERPADRGLLGTKEGAEAATFAGWDRRVPRRSNQTQGAIGPRDPFGCPAKTARANNRVASDLEANCTAPQPFGQGNDEQAADHQADPEVSRKHH